MPNTEDWKNLGWAIETREPDAEDRKNLDWAIKTREFYIFDKDFQRSDAPVIKNYWTIIFEYKVLICIILQLMVLMVQ